MSFFVDPATSQDPTSGLLALAAWGDAVDAAFNWLRNPKVGCHLTSTTTTAIGTDTVMPWTTELFDVGGCHDNVTNNSRITIPSGWGGLWIAGFNFAADCNAGNITLPWVVRNGATKLVGETGHPSNAAHTQAVSAETPFVMAAGDYFEVWVTGGGTRSASVTSHFYAWWFASGA